MMGKVFTDPGQIGELSVTKTTGNIIVLPKNHYLIRRATLPLHRIRLQAKSACVQCRMCTSLCPRNLIGHNMKPHLVMRNLFREPFITDNEEYKKAFGTAMNCSECGVCEMFSCPMGLSPRKVNIYIKGQLRERGIKVERNMRCFASCLLVQTVGALEDDFDFEGMDKAGLRYQLVDAEENRAMVERYGVRQAPTLVSVTKGGVQVVANASNIKKYAETCS